MLTPEIHTQFLELEEAQKLAIRNACEIIENQ